ncbi:hypothetical protein AHAS_Ahas03G0231700 [Arachis hypogaea]
MPRPASSVPHPCNCLRTPFWTLVLACHAQLLACHASALLWRLLQVARPFRTPSLLCCFFPIFDVFFT